MILHHLCLSVKYVLGSMLLLYIYRSHCHGNGHLNAAPKYSRHTASILHGRLIPYLYLWAVCRMHLNL